MIKETFYNLPQEKQQKIFDAAIKEFSRVDISGAKISNIVEVAEISRGSFYQYFDDIEDVLRVLGEKMQKTKIESLNKILSSEFDDIFDIFKKLIANELNNFKEIDTRLFKNLMKFHTEHIEIIKQSQFFLEKIMTVSETKKPLFDELNLPTKKEQMIFLGYIAMATFSCLQHYKFGKISEKEAIEIHTIQMEMIKNGVIKKWKTLQNMG